MNNVLSICVIMLISLLASTEADGRTFCFQDAVADSPKSTTPEIGAGSQDLQHHGAALEANEKSDVASKNAASRSVVSMLLNFTIVDNLLEAATRAPEGLKELASIDRKVIPVKPEDSGKSKRNQGENAADEDSNADTALKSERADGADERRTTEMLSEDAIAERLSQQRAVRSVRVLVVAFGLVAIVGLVRLLLHLNHVAHGNYAGRLQFIGWFGVTVILVFCLAIALNDGLWQMPESSSGERVGVWNPNEPEVANGLGETKESGEIKGLVGADHRSDG